MGVKLTVHEREEGDEYVALPRCQSPKAEEPPRLSAPETSDRVSVEPLGAFIGTTM